MGGECVYMWGEVERRVLRRRVEEGWGMSFHGRGIRNGVD